VKSPDAVMALVAGKTSRKRGRGRKLTRRETRTSAQDIAVAKPLGSGKILSAKSSGFSIAEKASLVGIETAGGKPKCALNLFNSDSSTSNDDTTPSQRPRKCAKDSSVSKQVAKPALTRAMFE
jgi:hypothetical protein